VRLLLRRRGDRRGRAQALNALVYLGTNQTTLAQVPANFVFRQVYAHGTPTLTLRRNFYVNSSSTALVDSWCGEGHENGSDSQCWLTLNGPGPYLLGNNYMEAGHEIIMFGGGDPSIPGLIPSDITIIGNHITRPTSWKGVWQVKNNSSARTRAGCSSRATSSRTTGPTRRQGIPSSASR
jgi:hypothetical protein